MYEYSENVKVLNNIKTLIITKRLNILIGSGASSPAIKLMSECIGNNQDEKNQDLMQNVKHVTSILLSGETSDIIKQVSNTYYDFFDILIRMVEMSNSREVPKTINVFTTNYDIFIENAIDELLKLNNFVFNDGTFGYFHRYLYGPNYNKTVSYKGLNDNYTDELLTINLIKPHGSVNWKKVNQDIEVCNHVVENFIHVPPTGTESSDTFMNNHFHEMLRIFQLELDKPQSILLVTGFSFQDNHIAKMVNRALRNRELVVFVFLYKDSQRETVLGNLGLSRMPKNLILVSPSDLVCDEICMTTISFENLTKLLISV